MKIEQKDIDKIKESFSSMLTKEDLLSLLNFAKGILYPENCNPIQLKSLTYYANPEWCDKRYAKFLIKKKSGGHRIINAPTKGLKVILRSLNLILQSIYEPHFSATGFVKNKSIVDNAKLHVEKNYVYNIDLKDFFHSFDRNRVKLGFIFEPFNLKIEREPLAFLIACLCTHPFEIDDEFKTVLPQGSPTSPTITNILCSKLDRRLAGLAKRFGAQFSRYADDITFSSNHSIFRNEEFLLELNRIISEDNLFNSKNPTRTIGPQLKINPDKTRLQKTAYQQEVTGLIVNKKVNVRRRYVGQIRMWLYYWEKYGYDKAKEIFIKDYISDKGHVKKGVPALERVLEGKLDFLKMVKGENDSTYLKLKDRYEKLLKIKSKTAVERVDAMAVFNNLLQTKNIDKAFSLFQKFKQNI